MLEVTNITVRTFDLDHLDIFWELESISGEDVEAYDFFILRSTDGMAGPYGVIGGPFYNQYLFRDPNVHQLHKWRIYFYKVRVTHRESQESRDFGPAWLSAEPDRIALEIQRREGLMFKEHIGRRVLYYPALTFGQRCVHCWDRGPKGNFTGRSKNQNCPTCFDTTFVGGYATPIALYVQIDPSPKSTHLADTGEKQYVETTGRTIAYPPMKPKDMIVEAENKRWRIENPVNRTEKLRAVIRQELKLRAYPPGDIKFKVPVTIDIQSSFSPPREYSRPMTVPAVDPDKAKGSLSQPQVEIDSSRWWEG